MRRSIRPALPTVLLAGCLAGCGTQAPVAQERPAVRVAAAQTSARRAEKQAEAAQPARPVVQSKKGAPPPAEVKKAAAPAVVEGPALPRDRAGKLVDEVLRPSEEAFAPRPRKARLPAGLRTLEQPELPLARYDGRVIRLPDSAVRKPARPLPPAEGVPLAYERTDHSLPAPVKLAVGPPVRLAAPDVNRPPPLPALARPQDDRGPPGDPTAQASLEAALAAPAPQRVTPAPFDRPAVPDPFENRHVIRLAAPPLEVALPPQVLPRTPPLQLPETGK